LDTLKRPDRTAQSIPSRSSSVSVTSATSTSISTWRGIRSSCLMVFSISIQLRGKVVTITALVISSAMKRTWPSARISEAPVPMPPTGGGAGGGCVGVRPDVVGDGPPGPPVALVPPPDEVSRAP
jgi:hypothetical protein